MQNKFVLEEVKEKLLDIEVEIDVCFDERKRKHFESSLTVRRAAITRLKEQVKLSELEQNNLKMTLEE